MPQLPRRLLSIDVIRAVTMFLMIFINDASGLKHIPLWIDHAEGSADAMGFADTIFPAFLFILGLSLPFAISNKIKKGESSIKILLYILSRSAALLIMGFYHVNLEEYSNAAAVLPRAVWALTITVAFFLIWLDYPPTMAKAKKYTLMGVGVVLLLVMAILYKGGNPAAPTGMRPGWWGILGIIGWSYLVCACVYFFTKGKLSLLVLFFILFAGVNIGVHMGFITQKIWLIGDGSSVTLTMGGIIISGLYARLAASDKTQRLWAILLVAGIGLIALGLFIRPYAEGISKIHSTPAWVFICTGINILVFELAIYLIDVKDKKDWFKLISPAGTSTLTCYLMPYFQVYIFRLLHIIYPPFLNTGAVGIIRSLLMSLILITLVGWMEKRNLRLKI